MTQAGEPDLTSTTKRIFVVPIASLLAVMLLAACGGSARQIKGEAPMIGLDGLTRSNGDLILNVSIRNVNDLRLEVSGLKLWLELDGTPAAETWVPPGRLSISPRGREVVRMQATATASAEEQLQRLTNAEQNNLPWRLKVEFDDTHRNGQPREARGFLHAVPGQPNRFR
ncbi:MAG: LEA type 2 family protein [Wenzhouxiangella sp.]